ncbi:DoxX family membrane protein [Pseudotabrizicola sp. 4114]|uniref:DoxX family protein n=1 Tax=Pseudotabrizicola sp. 4114 TaxID=2817731 RepID=UPI0028612328|nr:putative membrane protein YphA (DoxX/SURF4 family) [Pseudorhodobacter sp. 4114]
MTAVDHTLIVIASVLVTAPYWISACLKAKWFSATVAEVQGLGLGPAPTVARATIAVQALGSASLVFGVLPVFGLLALVAFTIAASFVGHPFWRLPAGERLTGANGFLANVGLLGGLLSVALLHRLS